MNNKHIDMTKKTCVVTGGKGFIGSHLCSRLTELGAQVISVDIIKGDKGTCFGLINKPRDILTITADLSDPSCINKIIGLKPDHIFHLCGLPYAPYTSIDPVNAFRANVSSTANMLEVARIASVEQFVLASSACVFGATIASPIPVNGIRCKPEHFYTYTKRQAENIAESYHEFYDVPISVCRFVNIYGPGDRHFGRLVPTLCKQLIESSSNDLTLFRSSGESVFEFLHVEDAVSGLLSSICNEHSTFCIRHFGTGPTGRMKVKDVANKLSILFDSKKRKLITKTNGSERTVKKYLDIQDTIANVGWKPEWTIDMGFSSTIDWYRKNINKIDPFDYAVFGL